MVEMGVLWEIASCGVIRGNTIVAVTDYEPFSNPGEALESLAGSSTVEVEEQGMNMRALCCSGSNPEMGNFVD